MGVKSIEKKNKQYLNSNTIELERSKGKFKKFGRYSSVTDTKAKQSQLPSKKLTINSNFSPKNTS